MTRLRHHLKGSCCGSACRHCVYNHEAVPYELRGARRFNSAFWVDATDTDDANEEGDHQEEEAQETKKDEEVRIEEDNEEDVSTKGKEEE